MEDKYTICSLECKLSFVYICSIRTLHRFKVIAKIKLQIKNRGSWNECYVVLHDAYLYIWKDEDSLVSQTKAKFSNELTGLLFEVNLSDCLCNVEYSSRKKHTFKITTKDKRLNIFENSDISNGKYRDKRFRTA